MSIVVGDSGVVVSGVVSGVDVDEGSFIASVAAVDSSVASVVVVGSCVIVDEGSGIASVTVVESSVVSVVVVDFGVVSSGVVSGIGVLGFAIDTLQVQPINV